jgi:hypothetical protein
MGSLRRLAIALCACAIGIGLPAGCGDDSDEVTLGSPTTPTKVETNRARIDQLERKLAARALKEREARRQSTPQAGGANVLSPSASSSFDSLAASTGGEIGVAMGPVGSDAVEQLGSLQTGAAWSTIKVPIAARVIEDAGGVAALPVSTRDLVGRAITASDNAAAAELWSQLGSTHSGPSGASAAVGELLAASGDSRTTVSTVGRDGFSPYGQTEWSLVAQEQFMSALAAGCVAPAASGELRRLMEQVVPDQRWGLGSANAAAYFKGGWGPGTDGRYLVRQVGVVEQDGGAIAVALAAIPSDGQFASGTATATRLAQWVVEHADWANARPVAC